MATAIHNPSVEICAMPAPLQGVLKGGETVILSYTLANLATNVPSLSRAFKLTELSGYSGADQDSDYGYLSGMGGGSEAITVEDAGTTSVLEVLSLSHTTTGTAAAGFGTATVLRAENGSGTVVRAGQFYADLAVVTAASEAGRAGIRPAYAGTVMEAGFRVTTAGAARVVGAELVLGATGVYTVFQPYGETNCTMRIEGTGTGAIEGYNPANTTRRIVWGATGLGFWTAAEAAQPAAEADLTATVAGDIPGPTPAEITTRLNLIETKMNNLLAKLRVPGFIAT